MSKGGDRIAAKPAAKTRSRTRKGVVEPTSATPVVQAPAKRPDGRPAFLPMGSSPNKERGQTRMGIVVNLAGVRTTLEVIPDGKYPANFVGKKFAMSKTNNPKCTLEYTFTAEAGEEIAGRKAFVECSLQPQSLFKIKKAMIDMGMDPEDLEGQIDLDEALDAMIGAETTIRVGHHEWEGSTRNDYYVVSPDSWPDN